MPIYEYRCPECGRTFEQLRSMRDADREASCPHCASSKAQRLLSAFATGGCGGSSKGGGRFT